ncbi:MAG TPA: hypothetical protein VG106_00255, partial [Vicinamibacterales bacterium]|nr:hypothetical protein [Vicinamibacterales bacterium]
DYEITSPRNEKVASGKATLNEYGSFWAELPLMTSMPLGAYHVTFKIGEDWIGSAQLFRLEEYKLPEFTVSVKTPEEDGKRKLYRLGDTIEATIEASYYFGGPVANAEVEVVVSQLPYYRPYPWREYDWYFPRPYHYLAPTVVKRETLRTDANGRATVRIDTQRDGNETEYVIEARVVDASRREVRGQGTVRVLKQRYTVIAMPEHFIHRPGEQVEVDFKAVDANDQPVQTTGTVKVTRRTWRGEPPVVPVERRRDPRLRPPGGYEDEEVLTTTVTTDAKGEASFTFTPKTTGYYRIQWTSEDRDPDQRTRVRDLVTTETTVWVADRATTDLGYRATSSGIEVIIDKETVREGETASAIVVTPSSGRWAVLTLFGDDILDTQVLRLDGTAKLVQVRVEEQHAPNFFVTATSIFDRVLSTDTERIVVPPVEHFIDVEVKADREEYGPRQEGTVTVTTRDENGRPVAAEVALAVSDEAVTAIQQDPAGDPRRFFFNETRTSMLHVSGSAQSQQYVRLVENEEK